MNKREGSSKKILALLLLAALMLTLFAGCGPASPSPSNETSAPVASQPSSASDPSAASSATDTKQFVELLRIGTTTPADLFNIFMEGGSYGMMNYTSFSAAPFLELDVNGELLPHIMTDWQIAEDNKSVVATFATDQGILWHDGQPVTMDDIVFTLEFMIERKSSYLKSMSAVERVDDKTLNLIFEAPDAFGVLSNIAGFVCVYPKHIWEDIPDKIAYTGDDAYIGCGPYKVTNIDKDAQIVTYEAVENYFKGEVSVKKVVVRSYGSHDALVMALRSDEVDAMYDYSRPLDSSMKPSVTGIENLDAGESANPGNFQMVFGFNKAPTNDISFRQAVAFALDYQLLATAIGGEDGEIADVGVVSPAARGYNGRLPKNAQDIEQAKSILDAAGYLDKDGDGLRESPSGEALSVLVTPQFSSARSALYLRICEITIENLKEIGVTAVLDEQSVRNSDYSNEFRRSGQYEIYIGYTSPGVALYKSAFMYMVPNPTNPWGTCADEDFVAAYDKLMSSANHEEYNENSAVIQKLAADKVVGISLCRDKAYYPYRTDKFEGWVNYPGWGVINSQTWYNLHPIQ